MKTSSKEFQKWLIAQLRRISYSYPARSKVKNAGKVAPATFSCMDCEMYVYTGSKTLEKSGLLDRFPISKIKKDEIHMDHKDPVIDPNTGFVDWNTFISRLFVEEDMWSRLCKECHAKKTYLENKTRQLKKHVL